MTNLEIKKIAIADDARVRIVMVEHRGEEEFEYRTQAYLNNTSYVVVEVDYYDTETNEFQILIDATLVAPGFIDDDYPNEYESVDEYVDTMSHYVETAISMYDDSIEVTVGVEHYDPKFEYEYRVKTIRDEEDQLRKIYDPQKCFDEKVKELTYHASGGEIKRIKDMIAEEKAKTGKVVGPFGQILDNTDWIKKLEERILPNVIEEQAESVEKLKTISIREFEDKYAKEMALWQRQLDRAIAKLEAA